MNRSKFPQYREPVYETRISTGPGKYRMAGAGYLPLGGCAQNALNNLSAHSTQSRNKLFARSDNFYFQQEIKNSMGPGRYGTDPIRHLPLGICFQNVGPPSGGVHVSGQGIPVHASDFSGEPKSYVDVDSDLKQLFFKNSKDTLCPSQRSSKILNCWECPKCNLGLPCLCKHCEIHTDIQKEQDNGFGTSGCPMNTSMIGEQTRSHGRACNVLSEVNINRFEPLCDNLQDIGKIDTNKKIGYNSRNLVKDQFLEKQYRAGTNKRGFSLNIPKPLFSPLKQ